MVLTLFYANLISSMSNSVPPPVLLRTCRVGLPCQIIILSLWVGRRSPTQTGHASKTFQWWLRAQSRSAKSPLRVLAAGRMLRVRELRCRCAAVKSAIHARRGEPNPTSPQIAVKSEVLGSFSITVTLVPAFTHFCVKTNCNA